MRIELHRTTALEIAPDALRDRLLLWAWQTGFALSEEAPGRWVFHRGSGWRSLYTTDIRNVPTTVVVLHESLRGEVACSLRCATWLGIETRGDRPRLEDDMDLLAASLHADELRGPGNDDRRWEWRDDAGRRRADHREDYQE
jgi:hypothetical protein